MTILQDLSNMTPGALKLTQSDPHGLTLTVVSILVVFGALLCLYVIYSIIGEVCMAGLSKKDKAPEGTAGEGSRKAAAAAVALYLAEERERTDIITISPSDSAWGGKGRNFRKRPGQ